MKPDLCMRRYTFALYPRTSQEAALRNQARLLAQLRNAIIELINNTYRCRREAAGRLPRFGCVMHRREPAWHQPLRPWSDERKAAARARRSSKAASAKPARAKAFDKPLILSFNDLTAEITALRHACPEYEALSVFSEHRVAKSVTEAYAAAFRKRAAGEKVEFPRFLRTDKATQVPLGRWGWKLSLAGCERLRGAQKRPSAQTWRLRLQGIDGTIRARGELPAEVISWKAADVIFRHGRWELSVCVEMAPRRIAGNENVTVTFDLIDEFARVERAEGLTLHARDDGARTSAQSPNHLNNMETADSDERVRAPPCAAQADRTGNPQTAGSDERAADAGISLCPQAAGNSQAAGSDERALYTDGKIDKTASLSGNSQAAGSDERQARDGGPSQAAGSDERGMRRHAGNSQTDGSDERAADADQIKSARDRRYRRGSWRWRRATAKAARVSARAARIRREQCHKWSTQLVREASALRVIAPRISEHVESPRGTARNWGACVAIVSELNRCILSQAPAAAIQMLTYKAEESGIRMELIEDESPKIAVGRDYVKAGKTLRRTRRAIRKEAA